MTLCSHRSVRALFAAIAVLSFVPVHALTTQLSTGIAPGAVACIPSANGTGHMVCAEYTNTGSVVGISWQAPGTFKVFGNPDAGHPFGTSGMVDPPLPLGSPAGTLVGAPSCAAAENGTGSATCLVVVKTGAAYEIQGVTFNPASNPVIDSGLLNLTSVPLTSTLSSPSCAPATDVSNNGTVNFQIICVIVRDSQLYGIGFNIDTTKPAPLTLNTGLQLLPLGSGFAGNPSCTSASAVGVCAVRNGNGAGLFGFAFDVSAGNTAPVTVGSITTVQPLQLAGSAVSGDPSCASPAGGPATRATCGVVNGAALLGISFDPMTQTSTKFQSLGSAPDGGSWNGMIGCAPVDDNNRKNHRKTNVNLMSCAVVSNTANLFEVTFDPQSSRALGLNGPYPVHANGAPSCLELAIDSDRLFCGYTTTTAAANASAFGTGLLQPFQMNAALANQ